MYFIEDGEVRITIKQKVCELNGLVVCMYVCVCVRVRVFFYIFWLHFLSQGPKSERQILCSLELRVLNHPSILPSHICN